MEENEIDLEQLKKVFNEYFPKIFEKENLDEIGDMKSFRADSVCSGKPSHITKSTEDYVFGIGAASMETDILANQNLSYMFRVYPIIADQLYDAIQNDNLNIDNLEEIQPKGHIMMKFRSLLEIAKAVQSSQDRKLWADLIKQLPNVPEHLIANAISRDGMNLSGGMGNYLEKVQYLFGKAPQILPYFLSDDKPSRCIRRAFNLPEPNRMYPARYRLFDLVRLLGTSLYNSRKA